MARKVFRIATTLAFGSVLLSLVRANQFPIRHAMLVGALLIVVRFPEAIEFGIWNSHRGLSHGSEATPTIVIQIAASMAMTVVLVVHHLLIWLASLYGGCSVDSQAGCVLQRMATQRWILACVLFDGYPSDSMARESQYSRVAIVWSITFESLKAST